MDLAKLRALIASLIEDEFSVEIDGEVIINPWVSRFLLDLGKVVLGIAIGLLEIGRGIWNGILRLERIGR